MKNMKLWQCKIRGFEAKNQSNLEEKISLCLLRSVVGRDDDSRWPNQHATSLVFSLEREAIRPILQPFFLRPFRVEVVQKDSLVSNIVLLKPIPPPSKDNICNFFLSKSEEIADWGDRQNLQLFFIKIRKDPRLGWFLLDELANRSPAKDKESDRVFPFLFNSSAISITKDSYICFTMRWYLKWFHCNPKLSF